MNSLPDAYEEFSPPTICERVSAPSSLLEFHQLILNGLGDTATFEHMSMNILTRRVGTQRFDGAGKILAQSGVPRTVFALKSSVTYGTLGTGNVAVSLGEGCCLDLRHEEEGVRRYLIHVLGKNNMGGALGSGVLFGGRNFIVTFV